MLDELERLNLAERPEAPSWLRQLMAAEGIDSAPGTHPAALIELVWAAQEPYVGIDPNPSRKSDRQEPERAQSLAPGQSRAALVAGQSPPNDHQGRKAPSVWPLESAELPYLPAHLPDLPEAPRIVPARTGGPIDSRLASPGAAGALVQKSHSAPQGLQPALEARQDVWVEAATG